MSAPWIVLAIGTAVALAVIIGLRVRRELRFCHNCDGRKCMSCVCREMHDACEDDCPDCCEVES